MDIQNMSDEEILETILEALEEDGRLPMNYLNVEVIDGSITISGRVSSEEETQIVDEIMTDTLSLTDYKNKVWVDESLTYEDPDDNPDIKDLSFEDDDDLDDQEYEDEEEDEDEYV